MPSRSLRLVNRIKKITWQESFSDNCCTKCLPQTKFSIWKKKESLSAFRSGKKLERTFGTKRLYYPLFWQQLLEWLAENQGKIVTLLSINPTPFHNPITQKVSHGIKLGYGKKHANSNSSAIRHAHNSTHQNSRMTAETRKWTCVFLLPNVYFFMKSYIFRLMRKLTGSQEMFEIGIGEENNKCKYNKRLKLARGNT